MNRRKAHIIAQNGNSNSLFRRGLLAYVVSRSILAISLIYANFMCACAVVVNKLVDWQQNFRSVYSIM